MLVDPVRHGKPPIGRFYARWTGPSAKNTDGSLGSGFDRMVAHIQAWQGLSADEEREHIESYRRDGHLHARLLRSALIAAKGAAKKWPDAHLEDLFAVAAAAMPAVLNKFDPACGRLSTLAHRAVQWAIVDCLTAAGILHQRADANAVAKAKLLRPIELVAPVAGAAADDGDDSADNDYSVGKAGQAWEYAEYDADELSDLTELLATLEEGPEKQAVTALLDGLTQKEIAAQLNVSEPTVSRALASAYAKLRSLVGIPAAADPEKADADPDAGAAA
jgi:RNA polymerase sigma factor (sigma-70 family)